MFFRPGDPPLTNIGRSGGSVSLIGDGTIARSPCLAALWSSIPPYLTFSPHNGQQSGLRFPSLSAALIASFSARGRSSNRFGFTRCFDFFLTVTAKSISSCFFSGGFGAAGLMTPALIRASRSAVIASPSRQIDMTMPYPAATKKPYSATNSRLCLLCQPTRNQRFPPVTKKELRQPHQQYSASCWYSSFTSWSLSGQNLLAPSRTVSRAFC